MEALKQDALEASEALTNKLKSNHDRGKELLERAPRDFTARKIQYNSRYLDSSSESDSDCEYDNVAPHKRRNTFFQHLQKQNEQHEVATDTSPPQPQTRSSKKAKTTKKSGLKAKAASANPGHTTPIPISSVKINKNNKSILNNSVDCGKNSNRRRKARSASPPKSKRASTQPRVSQSVSQSKNNFQGFSMQTAKDTDEKNAKLKLRLQGQLNTIRVLETQLAEAQHTIAVRDLELANALRRVNQLEVREKEKCSRKEHEDNYLRRSTQEEGKMYQIKTELVATQARFNDEKSRRSRAEERLRVIKEYCEKQKSRMVALEEKNEELEVALNGMRDKLLKKKREVKSNSKDMNLARVKVVKKDSELQTCKNELLRSQRSAKELRRDNDRLKEELRQLRREVYMTEDKNRRNELEMQVLRERQNATKLAYRLQNQNHSFSQLLSDSANGNRTSSNQSTSRSGPSKCHSRGSSPDASVTSNNSESEVLYSPERNCPYSGKRSPSRKNDFPSNSRSKPCHLIFDLFRFCN